MKFALVNNCKQEATPDGEGVCPVCGARCIAKCGQYKINHWAHKSKQNCDPWWESETPWHRNWKNVFPKEWQEVVNFDTNGEKHIADIKTDSGLVIEFQHSSIKPAERKSREQFHKTMLWVVDGTRCPSWWKRFTNETWRGSRILRSQFFIGGDMCLPEIWQDSDVAVVFDFLGDNDINNPEGPQDKLYCLLPNCDGAYVEITRQNFIKKVNDGTWIDSVEAAPNKVQKLLDKREWYWNQEIEQSIREREKAEYDEMKEKYCVFDLPE